jgi:hypothetical protein
VVRAPDRERLMRGVNELERRVALWLLNWQLRGLGEDIKWKSQHLGALKNQILDLQEDVAWGEARIEQLHNQRKLLQSEVWSLEVPGGMIKS